MEWTIVPRPPRRASILRRPVIANDTGLAMTLGWQWHRVDSDTGLAPGWERADLFEQS